jgi:hypothetical protein
MSTSTTGGGSTHWQVRKSVGQAQQSGCADKELSNSPVIEGVPSMVQHSCGLGRSKTGVCGVCAGVYVVQVAALLLSWCQIHACSACRSSFKHIPAIKLVCMLVG